MEQWPWRGTFVVLPSAEGDARRRGCEESNTHCVLEWQTFSVPKSSGGQITSRLGFAGVDVRAGQANLPDRGETVTLRGMIFQKSFGNTMINCIANMP